jgi:hypothetical protein
MAHPYLRLAEKAGLTYMKTVASLALNRPGGDRLATIFYAFGFGALAFGQLLKEDIQRQMAKIGGGSYNNYT